MQNPNSRLFVFDFDHTLIDVNSDTIIYQLFENSRLPAHLEELEKTTQWTKFMQLVDARLTQVFDEF